MFLLLDLLYWVVKRIIKGLKVCIFCLIDASLDYKGNRDSKYISSNYTFSSRYKHLVGLSVWDRKRFLRWFKYYYRGRKEARKDIKRHEEWLKKKIPFVNIIHVSILDQFRILGFLRIFDLENDFLVRWIMDYIKKKFKIKNFRYEYKFYNYDNKIQRRWNRKLMAFQRENLFSWQDVEDETFYVKKVRSKNEYDLMIYELYTLITANLYYMQVLMGWFFWAYFLRKDVIFIGILYILGQYYGKYKDFYYYFYMVVRLRMYKKSTYHGIAFDSVYSYISVELWRLMRCLFYIWRSLWCIISFPVLLATHWFRWKPKWDILMYISILYWLPFLFYKLYFFVFVLCRILVFLFEFLCHFYIIMYCYIRFGDSVFKEYQKDMHRFNKMEEVESKRKAEYDAIYMYRIHGIKTSYYEIYMEDDFEGLYVKDVDREIYRLKSSNEKKSFYDYFIEYIKEYIKRKKDAIYSKYVKLKLKWKSLRESELFWGYVQLFGRILLIYVCWIIIVNIFWWVVG